MTMNSEQRAALVKVLASWMRTAPLNRHLTIQEIAEDFIDRYVVPLVTIRAVPEPDEDTVERAATAMFEARYPECLWRQQLKHRQDELRYMARAALQGAGSDVSLTFDQSERIARDTFNSGYELGREHEADKPDGDAVVYTADDVTERMAAVYGGEDAEDEAELIALIASWVNKARRPPLHDISIACSIFDTVQAAVKKGGRQ